MSRKQGQEAVSYFNVMITTRSGASRVAIELDIGSNELEKRFLKPYGLGRPIVISGRTVNASDLESMQIFETPHHSNMMNEILLRRKRANNIAASVDVRGLLDPVTLCRSGTNVTTQYIKAPSGDVVKSESESTARMQPDTDAREVFVVHGRNCAAREALFEFLRALDLHPLEWSEFVIDTGKASPYIGETLSAAFSRAHAIVVLFTPDDEARIKHQFRVEGDPPHEFQLTVQARPNVLFEAGMAMARSQNRTVLVELGNLRPYSDVGGRYTIRLDNSTQRRQEVAQRLQAAGCPVNLEGTDWRTVGDFESAIDETNRSPTDAADQNSRLPIAPTISEDARELLLAAARSQDGAIRAKAVLGGLQIHTESGTFGEPGDRRAAARWNSALRELKQNRLAETFFGYKGIFQLTHTRFMMADTLDHNLKAIQAESP